MSKKTIKILSMVFTVAIVLMVSSSTLFALSSPSGVNTSVAVNGIQDVEDTGNQILGTIRTIGILLSVGILMVLGIKYMMGSAEEKASYKKTMVPYIIGAVILFAASSLAQVVFDFATGL